MTSRALTGTSIAPLEDARRRVDPTLDAFLSDRRDDLARLDPDAAILVEEIQRLLAAGGKRLRPAVCLWAYRAAGGTDDRAIERAAAALELLHTFALIHDDVMDASSERRGVEATAAHAAANAPPHLDAAAYGISFAILVGDLAAVFADELLRSCGAPWRPLAVALARFDRMRLEMAAGQLLDLRMAGAWSPRVAVLKTASYTVEGPVLVATALAEADRDVERALGAYGRSLGEAFQLRDDLADGQAAPEMTARVDALVDDAIGALADAPIADDGASALAEIAAVLRVRPDDVRGAGSA